MIFSTKAIQVVFAVIVVCPTPSMKTITNLVIRRLYIYGNWAVIMVCKMALETDVLEVLTLFSAFGIGRFSSSPDSLMDLVTSY